MPRGDGYDRMYEVLGTRITRARTARDLRQGQLADLVGVTRASIVNIEHGRQRAPLHLLWQIAAALDVELTALIPSQEELVASDQIEPLEPRVVASIERAARHDPEATQILVDFVRKARSSIEAHEAKRHGNE